MTTPTWAEPPSMSRNTEVKVLEPASSNRAVVKPRIIVQTTSEVDLLDYGYKWRKYGQKVVKGSLSKEGGDRERKNHLKVYEGLYYMSTRNFKKGTSLFLDLISTFTTYELFPYDNFIFYTVLNSIISLDKVSLKQKVVDALEILTVIGNILHLSGFLNSLYDCQYKSFFSAFEQIKLDRYLHPHFRYYMREVRTVVYSQFLESYKGVTLEAMAKAFGVTVEFIDLCLAAKGEESSECQRFAKYYWSPCLGEWTRNATGLVAPAIVAGLGALTHTLGTIVPVIGTSGFAITAAATVIGIIVGSFR